MHLRSSDSHIDTVDSNLEKSDSSQTGGAAEFGGRLQRKNIPMPDAPDDRKSKQLARSQQNRDSAKEGRVPDLDHLAKAALYVMLDRGFRDRGDGQQIARRSLEKLQDAVVAELVHRGFSERAAERVFDDQVAKHLSGNAPRRKVHLPDSPPKAGEL